MVNTWCGSASIAWGHIVVPEKVRECITIAKEAPFLSDMHNNTHKCTKNEGKACKQLISMHNKAHCTGTRHCYVVGVWSCVNFVHSAHTACKTPPHSARALEQAHHYLSCSQLYVIEYNVSYHVEKPSY